jgi:hypothetical protein
MESVAIIRCGSVGTKKLDRADRTDRKRVLDRTNSTQALFSTWVYYLYIIYTYGRIENSTNSLLDLKYVHAMFANLAACD